MLENLKHPKYALRRICFLGLAGGLLLHYLAQPTKVGGDSMRPTYLSNQMTLVNRLAYSLTDPKIGDVIIIEEKGEEIIKRIAGLPGERVSLQKGKLSINGREYGNVGCNTPLKEEDREFLLGDREYFFIGDNIKDSVYGRISFEFIRGKVVF